jgi:hypothetical protein
VAKEARVKVARSKPRKRAKTASLVKEREERVEKVVQKEEDMEIRKTKYPVFATMRTVATRRVFVMKEGIDHRR